MKPRWWWGLLLLSCTPRVTASPASTAAAFDNARRPRIDREEALLQLPGCQEFPQPSPDGRWLYFDGTLDNGFAIQRLELATGKVERLTQADDSIWDFSTEWNYATTLSPRGDRLVYLHDGSEGTELRLLPADGGDPVTLGPVTDTEPVWRAEGRVLSFANDGRLLEFDADHPGAAPFERAGIVEGFAPFGLIVLDADHLVARMSEQNSGETLWGMFSLDLTKLQPQYEVVPRLRARTYGLRFKTGERGEAPGSFYFVRGNVYDDAMLVYRTVTSALEQELPTKHRPVGGFARSADRQRLYYSSCYGYEAIAVAQQQASPRRLGESRADVRVAHARAVDNDRYVAVIGTSALKQALTLVQRSTNKEEVIDAGGDEPDTRGDQVVYVHTSDGDAKGIVWRKLGDKRANGLTSESHDHSPKWSHDGKSVLFLRGEAQDGRELYSADLDTGFVEKVAAGHFDMLAVSRTDDRFYVLEHDTHKLLEGRVSKRLTRVWRDEPLRGAVQSLHTSRDGKQLWVVRLQREVVAFDLAKPGLPQLIVNGGYAALTEVDEQPNGELLLSTRYWDGDLWTAHGFFP